MGKPFVGPLPTISTSSASGVWQMDEVFEYRAKSIWPPAPVSFDVEYLVIAGGGSGSTGIGGAGGAGGYRSSVSGELSGGGASSEPILELVTALAYTLTVGAGAPIGGPGGTGTRYNGNTGSNSVFASITSQGGGFGRAGNISPFTGGDGGSGGGASGPGNGNAYSGGTAINGQGYNGGSVSGNYQRGAGGGGAGQIGSNSSSSGEAPGPGGNGVASSITGTSVVRGGGGGGGTYNGLASGASGGSGGGGTGSNGLSANANRNGATNTGGGGGGGGNRGNPPTYTSYEGGNGGSGVVIIKYSDVFTATFSVGVTQTTTTSGGYKVSVVTAAGPSDTVTFS